MDMMERAGASTGSAAKSGPLRRNRVSATLHALWLGPPSLNRNLIRPRDILAARVRPRPFRRRSRPPKAPPRPGGVKSEKQPFPRVGMSPGLAAFMRDAGRLKLAIVTSRIVCEQGQTLRRLLLIRVPGGQLPLLTL